MGFRLVERVYSNVTGTSPTAQAVLAYLAFRADDEGVRKCYPSQPLITAATHFQESAVKRALKELRAAHLLSWVSGGRKKGGRPRANEYTFNLPGCTGRVATPAGAVSGPQQGPSENPCKGPQTTPIRKDQSKHQPSVIGGTEAETDAEKVAIVQVADAWSADVERIRAKVDEERRCQQRGRVSVLDDAMRVCRCDPKDIRNKKIFYSAILGRDQSRVAEEIYRFECELRAGEHKNLENPASELTKRIARLPRVC